MDGRINGVENTLEKHGEKIKDLEEFKDKHEEKHEILSKEHTLNTAKIQYIEKALLWVLGIVVGAVILAIIQVVISGGNR